MFREISYKLANQLTRFVRVTICGSEDMINGMNSTYFRIANRHKL